MKIKGWDDVDAALAAIADHEGEIAEAKARADEAKEAIAEIEPALETFVRDHEGDLLERSRAVEHGRVWLRQATRLILAHRRTNWKKVADALIAAKRWALLHTERKPDKEALNQLSDERLAELGIKRDTRDVFGYEAVAQVEDS